MYVPGRYAIDGLGYMESVGIHQEASSANTRGTFHVLSSLLCPILLSFIYPTHLRYGVFGLMVKSSRLHLAAERKAEIAAPRQQRLKELRASGSLPKLVRVGKPAQKVQKSEGPLAIAEAADGIADERGVAAAGELTPATPPPLCFPMCSCPWHSYSLAMRKFCAYERSRLGILIGT